MICNTGMYCANSHQGGSVHLWSATHSADSGALSGLAAVLAARLAAVLAAGLVAGARPHILICTAVRLAEKKNAKIYRRIQNWNPKLGLLQSCAYEKEPDEVVTH
jgi:hypothetical protein